MKTEQAVGFAPLRLCENSMTLGQRLQGKTAGYKKNGLSLRGEQCDLRAIALEIYLAGWSQG